MPLKTKMSALAGDGWHEQRREAPRDVNMAIGVDQNGRPVYPDKCVVIPGTKRPDGTRRKDRRVRAEQLPDGTWKSYVPQDEVEKYETRASRNAPAPRRPGAPPPGSAPAAGGDAAKPLSKSAKKNAARKAAKEKALEAAATAPAAAAPVAAAAPAAAAAPEDDLAKRAKALKKKLKSVSELQAKVDGGLAPNAEQAEKLGRAAELRADLADVEARLARL